MKEDSVNLIIKERYPDADGETLEQIMKLPQVLIDTELMDVAKGIEYCGDAEDYIDALAIYGRSIEAKSAAIEAKLADNDIEAYTITVHSLKSTSLAVGAIKIFEMARELEQAGKDKDIAKIKSDTPKLLEMYRRIKELL